MNGDLPVLCLERFWTPGTQERQRWVLAPIDDDLAEKGFEL